MTYLLIALLALAGGFLYRLRGTDVLPSTQLSRLLFWVVPSTVLAAIAAYPFDHWLSGAQMAWFFVLTWAFAASGHAVGMVFEAGHLGHNEPGHWEPSDGNWYDTISRLPLKLVFGNYDPYWPIKRKYAYTALAGASTGFARGLPWLLVGFWFMPVISAAGWVLAYWAGWQWIGYRKLHSRLAGQTEWAEFIYGAIISGAAGLHMIT